MPSRLRKEGRRMGIRKELPEIFEDLPRRVKILLLQLSRSKIKAFQRVVFFAPMGVFLKRLSRPLRSMVGKWLRFKIAMGPNR